VAQKKYHQEEWLREQYIFERKSSTKIADECGVTSTTILSWLDKHGIPRRDASQSQIEEIKKFHDEDWLRDQYVNEKRSMRDIAEECGVSPSGVKKWIDRFDIKTRGPSEYHKHGPASFFTTKTGYEFAASKNNYEADSVAIHQLTMIAEGVNPYKIFSQGRYHVHHKNAVKWDNRPENLEIKAASVHQADHNSPDKQHRVDCNVNELTVELSSLIADWRSRKESYFNVCADELEGLLEEN